MSDAFHRVSAKDVNAWVKKHFDEAASPRKGGAVCRGCAKHFVQETFPIGSAMRKVLSISHRLGDEKSLVYFHCGAIGAGSN